MSGTPEDPEAWVRWEIPLRAAERRALVAWATAQGLDPARFARGLLLQALLAARRLPATWRREAP